MLKSEGLWNIVRLQSEMERGALSGTAKRGLFKALALAGAAVEDVQSRGEYWIQVCFCVYIPEGIEWNLVKFCMKSSKLSSFLKIIFCSEVC